MMLSLNPMGRRALVDRRSPLLRTHRSRSDTMSRTAFKLYRYADCYDPLARRISKPAEMLLWRTQPRLILRPQVWLRYQNCGLFLRDGSWTVPTADHREQSAAYHPIPTHASDKQSSIAIHSPALVSGRPTARDHGLLPGTRVCYSGRGSATPDVGLLLGTRVMVIQPLGGPARSSMPSSENSVWLNELHRHDQRHRGPGAREPPP